MAVTRATPESPARFEVRPTRRDAERNHEAIVTAAIAVLADDPDASMQKVAAASGIGRSTLYRHFPDRDALVSAIYARVMAEAEGITLARLGDAGGRDAVAVIAELAAELAGLGDRYRFLERCAPATPAGKGKGTSGSAGSSEVEAALERYLAAAQRRGEIRRDLDARWLLEVFGSVVTAAAAGRYARRRDRASMVAATIESLLRPSRAE
jgi:AcrR family transcriptional regulator